ncbi:hypothetical protein ADUPG1_006730, partial [Aduncisulcus paluster]
MQSPIEAKDQILWYNILPGSKETKKLRVKNISTQTLTLNFRLPITSDFGTPFPDPVLLPPGIYHDFEISYVPTQRREIILPVEFFVEPMDFSFTVNLVAKLPDLRYELPKIFDFTQKVVSETSIMHETLHNTGTVDFEFEWRTSAPFWIIPATGMVKAGEKFKLDVYFHPPDAALYKGTAICIMVAEGEEEVTKEVPFQGLGKYPFPVITSDILPQTRTMFGKTRRKKSDSLLRKDALPPIDGVSLTLPATDSSLSPSQQVLSSLDVGSVMIGRSISKSITLHNHSEVPATFYAVMGTPPQLEEFQSDLIPMDNDSDLGLRLGGPFEDYLPQISIHPSHLEWYSGLQNHKSSVESYVSETELSNTAFRVFPSIVHLLPNESTKLEVFFSPSVPGSLTDTLTVFSMSAASSSISISGIGEVFDVIFSHKYVDFGAISMGSSRHVTLKLINRSSTAAPFQIICGDSSVTPSLSSPDMDLSSSPSNNPIITPPTLPTAPFSMSLTRGTVPPSLITPVTFSFRPPTASIHHTVMFLLVPGMTPRRLEAVGTGKSTGQKGSSTSSSSSQDDDSGSTSGAASSSSDTYGKVISGIRESSSSSLPLSMARPPPVSLEHLITWRRLRRQYDVNTLLKPWVLQRLAKDHRFSSRDADTDEDGAVIGQEPILSYPLSPSSVPTPLRSPFRPDYCPDPAGPLSISALEAAQRVLNECVVSDGITHEDSLVPLSSVRSGMGRSSRLATNVGMASKPSPTDAHNNSVSERAAKGACGVGEDIPDSYAVELVNVIMNLMSSEEDHDKHSTTSARILGDGEEQEEYLGSEGREGREGRDGREGGVVPYGKQVSTLAQSHIASGNDKVEISDLFDVIEARRISLLHSISTLLSSSNEDPLSSGCQSIEISHSFIDFGQCKAGRVQQVEVEIRNNTLTPWTVEWFASKPDSSTERAAEKEMIDGLDNSLSPSLASSTSRMVQQHRRSGAGSVGSRKIPLRHGSMSFSVSPQIGQISPKTSTIFVVSFAPMQDQVCFFSSLKASCFPSCSQHYLQFPRTVPPTPVTLSLDTCGSTVTLDEAAFVPAPHIDFVEGRKDTQSSAFSSLIRIPSVTVGMITGRVFMLSNEGGAPMLFKAIKVDDGGPFCHGFKKNFDPRAEITSPQFDIYPKIGVVPPKRSQMIFVCFRASYEGKTSCRFLIDCRMDRQDTQMLDCHHFEEVQEQKMAEILDEESGSTYGEEELKVLASREMRREGKERVIALAESGTEGVIGIVCVCEGHKVGVRVHCDGEKKGNNNNNQFGIEHKKKNGGKAKNKDSTLAPSNTSGSLGDSGNFEDNALVKLVDNLLDEEEQRGDMQKIIEAETVRMQEQEAGGEKKEGDGTSIMPGDLQSSTGMPTSNLFGKDSSPSEGIASSSSHQLDVSPSLASLLMPATSNAPPLLSFTGVSVGCTATRTLTLQNTAEMGLLVFWNFDSVNVESYRAVTSNAVRHRLMGKAAGALKNSLSLSEEEASSSLPLIAIHPRTRLIAPGESVSFTVYISPPREGSFDFSVSYVVSASPVSVPVPKSLCYRDQDDKGVIPAFETKSPSDPDRRASIEHHVLACSLRSSLEQQSSSSSSTVDEALNSVIILDKSSLHGEQDEEYKPVIEETPCLYPHSKSEHTIFSRLFNAPSAPIPPVPSTSSHSRVKSHKNNLLVADSTVPNYLLSYRTHFIQITCEATPRNLTLTPDSFSFSNVSAGDEVSATLCVKNLSDTRAQFSMGYRVKETEGDYEEECDNGDDSCSVRRRDVAAPDPPLGLCGTEKKGDTGCLLTSNSDSKSVCILSSSGHDIQGTSESLTSASTAGPLSSLPPLLTFAPSSSGAIESGESLDVQLFLHPHVHSTFAIDVQCAFPEPLPPVAMRKAKRFAIMCVAKHSIVEEWLKKKEEEQEARMIGSSVVNKPSRFSNTGLNLVRSRSGEEDIVKSLSSTLSTLLPLFSSLDQTLSITKPKVTNIPIKLSSSLPMLRVCGCSVSRHDSINAWKLCHIDDLNAMIHNTHITQSERQMRRTGASPVICPDGTTMLDNLPVHVIELPAVHALRISKKKNSDQTKITMKSLSSSSEEDSSSFEVEDESEDEDEDNIVTTLMGSTIPIKVPKSKTIIREDGDKQIHFRNVSTTAKVNTSGSNSLYTRLSLTFENTGLVDVNIRVVGPHNFIPQVERWAESAQPHPRFLSLSSTIHSGAFEIEDSEVQIGPNERGTVHIKAWHVLPGFLEIPFVLDVKNGHMVLIIVKSFTLSSLDVDVGVDFSNPYSRRVKDLSFWPMNHTTASQLGEVRTSRRLREVRRERELGVSVRSTGINEHTGASLRDASIVEAKVKSLTDSSHAIPYDAHAISSSTSSTSVSADGSGSHTTSAGSGLGSTQLPFMDDSICPIVSSFTLLPVPLSHSQPLLQQLIVRNNGAYDVVVTADPFGNAFSSLRQLNAGSSIFELASSQPFVVPAWGHAP